MVSHFAIVKPISETGSLPRLHQKGTFLTLDLRRRRLAEPELRERLASLLGNKIDRVINTYKKTHPNATP